MIGLGAGALAFRLIGERLATMAPPWLGKWLPFVGSGGVAGVADSASFDYMRDGKVDWKKAGLAGILSVAIGFAGLGVAQYGGKLIGPAVVSKINDIPLTAVSVFKDGTTSAPKTVGDTPFGAWLQKFAGKRTDKSSSPKFDFAKVRKEGIKKIENKYGGVVEGESNKSSVLNPRDIRFMQSTISNKTGDYTVFNNANTFSKNPSKIFELEPIRVWKDGKGNIWTLDHRRLGAARLAEIDKIPVRWVSKAEVYKDAWKLTTKVDGKSVILKNGDGTTHIIK
ncbi:ParB/Srx family N-terminal domain-containing protein [Laceyella tengchongensis]